MSARDEANNALEIAARNLCRLAGILGNGHWSAAVETEIGQIAAAIGEASLALDDLDEKKGAANDALP